MKKLLIILLAAAIAAGLCACAANKEKQKSSASSTEKTELDKLLDKYGFSGVVSVSQGDKRWVYASGEADADNEITEESLFCVGSLAKQFTATAVLQLQEQGKLRVTDTLDVYFPDCDYGKEVTLHQMLTMYSGIAEFYDVEEADGCLNELPTGELRGAVTNDNTAAENRALLQEWLLRQPLEYEPGSMYAYTNSNYFLLAQIIEKVSGESYEDYIRRHLLEPLEMDSTGFIDELINDPRLVKSPHDPKTVYVGITRGLGDLVSNAEDMDKWLSAFSGNKLLSEESLKAMTTNYCLPSEEAAYGYGLMLDSNGALYHTGIFTSYSALVYVIPSRDYRFFAVTNDQLALPVPFGSVCQQILSKTLKE